MRTLLLIAMAVGLTSLVALAQDRPGAMDKLQKKSVTLPMNVEKGREYHFRVEMEARQEAQAGQETTPAREPSQQAGPTFGVNPTGGTNFDYHFVTQDVKDNQYTVTFTFTLDKNGSIVKETGLDAAKLPFEASVINSHIHLIFGAGLHQ